MRLIFFLLLTINVVMLAWRLAGGADDYALEPGRGSNPPRHSGQEAQIRLLGEAPPAPDSVGPAICKMAGPFAGEREATHFIERLAALDVGAEIQRVEQPAGQSHWVYFDPQEVAEGVKARLRDLRARGVDSYIIQGGELAQAISVGVFSSRAAAEVRQQELAEFGYTPKIRSVDRVNEEVWVALGQGEEQKIANSAWQTLVEDTFSVRERENLCLDVASR